MSSYGVVPFTDSAEGFKESTSQNGPLRTWDVQVYLDLGTDYDTLLGLRSWNVSIRTIPGGSSVYVDVGGGAGAFPLTLDDMLGSPWMTVLLTDVSRGTAYPGGGRLVQCRFQEVPA